MKDICCIGHITKDKIITPQSTTYMSGGTSFYFAHALSCLPKKVSFELVTKLSDEDFKAVEELRSKGVDVTSYKSLHTVFFENKYGKVSDNRTQRVLERAEPFTVAEVEPLEAKMFHLGSLLDDDFPVEVVECLSRKGLVSIDAQGYLRRLEGESVLPTDWKDKLRILAMTDILKVNEHEIVSLTGYSDPHEAARQLAEWGVKEVCVTLGSHGSIIYADGVYYDIPAYEPAEVVDATGCGDTYSAGYLWCRAQELGYYESGCFAAAMCTLKLEHSGPFCGTEKQVHRIIDNYAVK